MVDILVNTSFMLTISFGLAAALHLLVFLRVKRESRYRLLRCAVYAFMAVLYFLTQFGPEWFLIWQRVFFRMGTTGIVAVEIYGLLRMYSETKQVGLWKK